MVSAKAEPAVGIAKTSPAVPVLGGPKVKIGISDVGTSPDPKAQEPGGFANIDGFKQMESILFETDYPHSDGTFPRSREVAHRLCEGAGLDAHECWQFLRGNAITAYGLERFGITE